MPDKFPERARAKWVHIVPLVALMVALATGAASLVLPPPIIGPLQPGLVPALLAAVTGIAAILCLWWPGIASEDGEAPGFRPLIAAALAVIILALGTRSIGIAATTLLSATITTAGVAGVTVKRAIIIGIGFTIGVSLMFGIAKRQPLPILPPGYGW